jgi:hypothetical protein
MFKERDMNSIFAKILSHLFLTVACVSLLNFNSGQVYGFEPFDIQVKKRVDSEARKTEIKKEERKILKGNIIAWLINQVPISEKEEYEAASELHEKLVNNVKIILTPEKVNKVFNKLVANIPVFQKFNRFNYKLFVLDQTDLNVFTNGGGYVYITKPLMEKFIDYNMEPTPGLYFILGNELGKISLKHTRRHYQLVEIKKELSRSIDLHVEDQLLNSIFHASISPIFTYFSYMYIQYQYFQTDIFAFYLCRNSGVKPEDTLDALRFFVIDKYPKIKESGFNVPAESNIEFFTTFRSFPLVRLKYLLNELEGVIEDSVEKFGLFQYQKNTKKFELCKNKSILGDKSTLVFCHGLKGNQESFKDLIEHVAKNKKTESKEILVFRYPNIESLSKSGQFLTNEIKRVFQDPQKIQFICHSAGGLVFRFYAEVKEGLYDQVFFIATPHKGTSMTKYKFLLDLNEFSLVSGTEGISKAISETISEGRGEIGFDLHSGSLFLSYLNSFKSKKKNYFICNACFTGDGAFSKFDSRVIKNITVINILEQCLPIVKDTLNDRAEKFGSPLFKKWSLEILSKLEIPDEIKKGDLAVTVESTKIEGGEIIITGHGLNHLTILTEPKVINEIIKRIALVP